MLVHKKSLGQPWPVEAPWECFIHFLFIYEDVPVSTGICLPGSLSQLPEASPPRETHKTAKEKQAPALGCVSLSQNLNAEGRNLSLFGLCAIIMM